MPTGHRHWTRQVFLDHAEFYGSILTSHRPAAIPQVRGLRRLFRKEGVPEGGRVVDIACGVGRHIIPLARAGFDAVGCDFSPPFLAEARAYAVSHGVPTSRCRFYRSDYRRIDATMRRAGERSFDAAICLFTSMGHYGEAGDLATLRAVRRIVRPGGIFVLEMGSRDWVVRHFRPRGLVHGPNGLVIREVRRMDWETSTIHSDWTFYRGGGSTRRKVLETEVTVRLYSLHELMSLFARAGWRFVRAYGSLSTLQPVGLEARRLVVVARAPRR